MECAFALFVIMVVLLAAIGSIAGRRSGKLQRRRSYQKLAKRFLGVYAPGGFLRRPAVKVRYGETRAFLRETKGLGPFATSGTMVLIDWPDLRLEFDLTSRQNAGDSPLVRRFSTFELGQAEFDAKFVLRAKQTDEAKRIFSDGVCWQLTRLAALDDAGKLFVQARRAQIVVFKPQLIRRYEDLETMLTISLDLYDQIMLTRAEGIEFLVNDAVTPLEQVKCTVCGDEIVSDMVYCQRCKTPHHGECWKYVGGCTIYGCRESHFLLPRAAIKAQ